MRTASLAAWDARWSWGEAPERDRFVFIMDEAGMVGAGQWMRIAGVVKARGGKLIAVGDPEQLQPVSDLPGWAAVERGVSQATRGAPVAALSSVRRQRSMADRMATEALARGGAEIAPAIRHYIDKGALRLECGVLNDPVGALAAAYYKTGPGKAGDGAGCARLALAYTNREVWALNDAIRAQALARGEIDQAGIRDYGTITRIDRTTPTHERIAVPLAVGPGDRVMLTRPHRGLDLPRSAFGTVVATRADGIDLLVDGSSRAVTLDLATFRDLDYGYAATIHKSQGVTVDHTLVLGHGRMNRHAIYVALTRHRDSVTVFGRAGHLSCPADLITLAHAPGHLSIDIEDGPHAAGPPGGMVASAAVLGLGARGDWLGSGVSVETGAACDGGRLRLRIDEGRSPQTGRMDVRDVVYAPNSELPDWRFAFAGTIHGEMGRARDSVHLLAAPGLNLHLLDLTVTVPCAAARLGEVMGRILRRTASAPSVIDYGFDASLGAREALRGQVYQEAAGGARTGMARAVARLRDLAGLAGDPGAAARVLPRGLEGAVLAEVIGAAILHDGAAPEGEDRLAVERVVRDMSDARAWRRVLRRVPSTLPGAADDLAATVAGRDGAARLLAPARILARGALTAQAMGEDRVAALFERGLGLYGKRAGAARLLGRPEDLVAPQRDRQMEFAWPDPGLRPERGRSAVIGPPRGQRRVRWRLDIGRLLGDVPRADTIMAEQVLEGLAGMFGLGPRAGRFRRSGRHAARRYAAWQAADRSGGGHAISAGDDRQYAGVALQMACALTDRIPADSKVHQLPLPADIARMLARADTCSDLPQEKVNTIAREIAEDRAAFESKIAFARELVASDQQIRMYHVSPDPFYEYMFVAQLRKDSGSDRDGQHPMRLNAGPLQERYTDEVDTRVAADLASGLARPTKEEHLVARLSLLPDRSEDEASIAAALNEALRWGRPMEGAKLQHERAGVLQGLGSAGDIDEWDAQDLLARLYRSHTFQEIRALADPERDLPATMLPIGDAARGAAAHGYAKSAQVASDVLTNFSWTPHMRQHGPEIESPSMSDGLAMEM